MTMNPEIESCLNTLVDRPMDPQAVEALKTQLSAPEEVTEEVLEALEKALDDLRGTGHWEAMVALLEILARHRDDGMAQARLLAEQARILEEELLEEEAALALFQRVLQLNPEDEDTRDNLETIEMIREDWEKVVDKYLDEANSAHDRKVATSLFLSAAEVAWRNAPGDAKVEQYLRKSLDVEPRNWKSSRHLERHLRQEGRFDEVADLLKQRADLGTTRSERLAAFLALGDLWARDMHNPEEAVANFRLALSLEPANPNALRFLVETLTQQEDWPSLVKVYEDMLRTRPKRDVEEGTLVQIGLLYDHKIGDRAKAEEYFRRVRKIQPTQPVMLDFYRRFYGESGEGGKLLALLDSAHRSQKDPQQKVAIAMEMADVAMNQVQNLDKAIDIWKGILRLDPTRTEAKDALKKLYRESTPPKWNALRELYKDEIEKLDADQVEEKIAIHMEIMKIYRDHLKLDVMVINTYNAILALQPDHTGALDALTEKFESMGRWNDLIGLLMKRKDASGDTSEKVTILHRVADLWMDKFGNQSQAIKPLEEILGLDPIDDRALTKLKEVHTKRRNWREMIKLLTNEATRREGQQQRGLFKEIAELAAKKVGDPGEGIQIWNRMLEQNHHDEEALNELAALYEQVKRWPALAEVYHRQVEVYQDDSDKVLELLEKLGNLYTNQLPAADAAIDVWSELLRIQPESDKAKKVLRDLYVEQQRWEDLEMLFQSRQDYVDLAETLSAAADRSDDATLKVQLHVRVGEICRDKLENPAKAIDAYEQVMNLEPEKVEVARALVPLYLDGEKWARLLDIYEVLLQQTEDHHDKLELLEKTRRLCEEHLDSKTMAFSWCAQTYALDPDNPECQRELERLAEEADQWDELVHIYTDRVGIIEDIYEKAAMLRKLAHLSEEHLDRPEDAEVFFRELLELYPEDIASMEALERIYIAGHRWLALVEIYEKRVDAEQDLDQKVALLFKVATILEEEIHDPGAAVTALKRLVDFQPDNLEAFKALERLYEGQEDFTDLVDVLGREMDLVQDDEARVNVLYRLGWTLQHRLDEHERAIEYFSQVLSLHPAHGDTVEALEEYVTGESLHREAVARLLEPNYEGAENWASLVHVLEILLDYEHEEHARVDLFKRLMSLHNDKLEQPQEAFEAGAQILAINGSDRQTREELARLAEALDRGEDLSILLQDALEELGEGDNPSLELSLNWELALLLEERLGRPDEAEPRLRRVVEIDPLHKQAFDTLERILRQSGKWVELRDLLAQKKDLEEEADSRRDILLQICAINDDFLEDPEAAVLAYEEVLDIEPDHKDAFKALRRHYSEAERWEEMQDLLRREMSFAQDEETICELKLGQAEIMARQLEDIHGATDMLEDVLQMAPAMDAAVELMEALFEMDDNLQRRISEILERVYDRREEWDSLARILLVRRPLAMDNFEAVDLLCRAAVLQEEKLADPLKAFESYREALLLDPGALRIHEAVQRLGQELGAWEETAETWQAAFEAADEVDLSLRARLQMHLAKVYDERLEDAEKAQEAYELLAELDPSDLEIARPAAVALTRLYELAGLWPELITVLRRQVEWEDDPEKREQFLVKICRIQEEVLGEVGEAIDTFRMLLDENPNSSVALDSLERLYLSTERFADLVEIYRRRVDLADTAEQRRDLWNHIASLQEDELEDMDQAIHAYLMVLDEIPDDVDAMRALARMYQQAERWSEFLEMLERELSLDQAAEQERIDLIFKIADIQHRHMLNLTMAVERYQQVLDLEHGHEGTRLALEELLDEPDQKLAAAELLAPIYQRESNWERLITIYQLQAEEADIPEKVALLVKVAQLYEDGLDDMDNAFEAYRLALSEAVAEPEFLDLLDQYHRLARTLERWAEFVETIEEIVVDIMDAEAQKTMHLHAASVSRDYLDDLERSKKHYSAVLDSDPEHEEALQALDGLFEVLEDWTALLEIIHRRVELESGEDARRTFLCRSAMLCRDRLDLPDDAIVNYESVLEMFPQDGEAVDALDSLYALTERWPDLAMLLERRLEFTEEPDLRMEFFHRLGDLRNNRLDDQVQALEAYQEVLKLEPLHDQVITSLEAFLEDPGLQVEASLLLEPIYMTQQEWEKLVNICRIRLEASDDPDLRLALTKHIAQLYEEQLDDLESAFSWYGKVFLEDPADEQIREQLLRLAGVLENWDALAEVLSRYLDDTLEENQTTREVAILLGGILEERLEKIDEAADCLRRALQSDRADEETFRLLDHLLTRHERWEDLLALYQEMAEHSMDVEERKDLLLKKCRVWEEALFNLPEAIDAYRDVLDQVDNEPEAVHALDRLYTETERWQDLTELLSRQAEFATDDQERVALKFRTGVVHEQEMEDLHTAVDYYNEVLTLDANHEEAIESLERLIREKDLRFSIAQILEPIYQAQEEWTKLVVAYDAQLEFIEDRERRVFMLKEIARLHETMGGSLEQAFSALSKAFEEEFGDPELMENLESLTQRLNNWPELVEVFLKGVDELYNMDLQAGIYARVATLQEERLADREAAVESWKSVLKAREYDGDAIRSLIRLLEVLERSEELIDILKLKAEHSTDAEEQKITYLRIAEIQENILVQPDQAIESYRQLLLIDEHNYTALDALDRLYLMGSDWAELIWVFRRKIEICEDETERHALMLSVAQVYEDKLEDNYEAIAAYKLLQEEIERDISILNALDRLFSRESHFSDLLEVLEAKTELEEDPEERMDLRFRTAAIMESEIGDLDGAIDRYRMVMEEDPTHEEAREALERLVRGDSHRELVSDILENLYSVTGEVQPLVEVLELKLENMADMGLRRDLLMRIGQLYEDGLSDPQGAFSTYAKALAEDPADETVHQELDRLASVLECIPELVKVYEGQLDQIYDSALCRSLHLKVAQLEEEILGDDEGAEKHYRAALDYDGDKLSSLLALDRILMRQEKWTDLVDVLEKELEEDLGPEQRAEIFCRVGEIRVEEQGDLDGAFSAYRNALELNPTLESGRLGIEKVMVSESYQAQVLDVLEPLYEASGDFIKLVDLLEIRLTTMVDPFERTDLLKRIARIHEQELDYPDQALGAFGRALAENPANEQVLDELERLAGDLGRYAELVKLGEEVLAGEITVDTARVLGLRTAEWSSKKLNDIEQAQSILKKVLEIDSTCVEALEELENIHRAGSDFEDLADVLWRRSECEFDPAKKRALLAEVAEINHEQLDNPQGAITAWNGVLEQDGEDYEALTQLAMLYEGEEDWEAFVETLDRHVMLLPDVEEQVRIKSTMGKILCDRIGDPMRAIEVYRDIMDMNPGNTEALDRLEEIYASQEEWSSVQEIMMRRLEELEEMDRIPIFFNLAELTAIKLDNLDEAVGYLHQITALDPGNLAAIGQLEDLLRGAEKWYDLVDVLGRHAEIIAREEDTAGEVEKLVEAANIWNAQLENPEAAAEILEQILERDESNVLALSGLAKIYETTEQWDRCQEVLERAAAQNPESKEAAELEFRLGSIAMLQSNDSVMAAAHFVQALEFDPGHQEAHKAYESHCREMGDWAKVAELLESSAQQAGEEEQLKIFMELGSIYADKLNQPDESVAALELARELDPENVNILTPLADAYYLAGRYEDAEPMLERLMEQSVRGRRKDLARYTFRMGTIAEKKGDTEGARGHFDKAYRLDSTYGPNLVALGRIYMAQEDWAGARRIYRSMLLQNLEQDAGIAKADIFYYLGRAHMALNETSKALSMFERGLEVAPDHEGLQQAMEEAKG